MNNDIVVLADAEGNLYVFTPDLIQMAQVHSGDHRTLVTRLVESGVGCDRAPAYSVVATYAKKADPFIRRDFAEPLATLVPSGAKPDP